MKNLLFKLLSLRTLSSEEDNLNQSLSLIENYLDKYCLGKVIINKYVSGSKPSMVIIPKNSKEIQVFLVGHLDVVAADYYKAFSPYEKQGRIYARGASDMKGLVVAMLYAFKSLVNRGVKDVGLMFTTDEEIGGFNGVRFLLNEKEYSCNVAFIPDGGDNWKICTDQKAVYHITVVSKGVSAHGSRPWKGENANLKLLDTYKYVEQKFCDRWGDFLEKESFEPTVNLGLFNGGDSINKVPDNASMKLDIRFPENVRKKEMDQILQEACNRFDCSFEVGVYGNAFHTNKKNKYVNLWFETIKNRLRESSEGVWKVEHGASDARFFSEKGIPCVISKPTCSGVHIDNEWIDYNSLIEFGDYIIEWVENI